MRIEVKLSFVSNTTKKLFTLNSRNYIYNCFHALQDLQDQALMADTEALMADTVDQVDQVDKVDQVMVGEIVEVLDTLEMPVTAMMGKYCEKNDYKCDIQF